MDEISQSSTDLRVVRLRDDDLGRVHALVVKRGRKYIHLILMHSGGIRVRKVPRSWEQFMEDTDYPVEKMVAHLRGAAERFNGGYDNLSIEAKEVLDAVR